MKRFQSHAALLAALFAGVVALAILAALPRAAAPSTLPAGAEGAFVAEGETAQLRNFFGFHGPEPAGDELLRWTTGEGSFLLRNAAHYGSPQVLTLRLCGCRGGEDPIALRLQLNGAPVMATPLDSEWGVWRTYQVLVPQRDAAYTPDLLVELLSDSAPHPEFARRLGVAYGGVRLAPIGTQRPYSAAEAAGLALGVAVIAVIAGWRSSSLRAAIGAGVVGILAAVLQGYLYQPHPLLPIVPAAALLLALALAIALERQPAAIAILGGLLAVPPILVQLLGVWTIDDAYISFRYALNALNGHGFVFNVGERVEGYTNFLWVALFVPVLALGVAPAAAAQFFTLLFAQLGGALVWSAARRRYGAWPAAGALALLMASTPFILWTARGSGMETALFSLLLLAGVVACIERRVGVAGLLLGLAAMTRPEGVLAATLCGAFLVLPALVGVLRREQPIRRAVADVPWRDIGRLASGFLVIFAPYYLWRYSYYGYPLPNTFYAKVGATGAQVVRGAQYAAEFAAAQWPLLLILLLGALAWLLVQRATTRPAGRPAAYERPQLPAALLPALLCCMYAAYIIAVGGDHFPIFRFFVPLLPLMALLCAAALAQIAARMPRAAAAPALITLVLLSVSWQAPQLYASRTLNAASGVWGEQSVVDKNREIGLWLRDNTAPDTLVATGIAGALAYYSERPVLDTLGLNDLHIARIEVATMGQGVAGSEKFDREYVLERQPVYIPYSSADGLRGYAEFDAAYRRIIVRGPEGRGVRLYVRAETAAGR
jgi:uncharacterized membrane protein (GlpM family)